MGFWELWLLVLLSLWSYGLKGRRTVAEDREDSSSYDVASCGKKQGTKGNSGIGNRIGQQIIGLSA